MAPTLSMAPAPQPGDHVKFLSFFSTSHEYSISNPYLFFFYCHYPNSGSFTFSCVILGVPYSLPFPLVSSPFSPALYSLTLALLVAPCGQVNQGKYFTAEFKVFCKVTPSQVSGLTFTLCHPNHFSSYPLPGLLLHLPCCSSCLG